MMKNYLISILLSCIIIISIFPPTIGQLPPKFFGDLKSHKSLLGEGWLEEQDGVKILHISGTHYQMGYQHGFLLQEECKQNLRAFLADAEQYVSYQELLDVWFAMEPHVSDKYLNELHGLADGANVSFEDLVAAYMTIPWGDRGCFGFAATGPATIDGELYHARSFDLPFIIKDPVSDTFVHEKAVLIVRNPNQGHPSICPSVAGTASGGGGFNSEGIAIGTQVCWNSDYTFSGIPMVIRVLMVLDQASSLDEAIDIINTNRTMGYNFIISDAIVDEGVAVEQNAHNVYVGRWDNETEELPPFWKIDNVIRRTNFFIDPIIAGTQRDRYDPSGLIGFLKLLFTSNFFFAVWMNYKVTSAEIQKNWGNLDVNTSLNVLQQAYSGKTNLLLFIMKKLAYGTSFLEAWNQWAANAETGDIAVSFASRNVNACNAEVHNFNLYELLTAQPP